MNAIQTTQGVFEQWEAITIHIDYIYKASPVSDFEKVALAFMNAVICWTCRSLHVATVKLSNSASAWNPTSGDEANVIPAKKEIPKRTCATIL